MMEFICLLLHHLWKLKLKTNDKHTIIFFLSPQTLNETLDKVSYESACFHRIAGSHSNLSLFYSFAKYMYMNKVTDGLGLF